MKSYEFHPVAGLFPLLEGAEFLALVEDIRQNGVREPITLTEGKILDGRNRYRACKVLDIDPPTREWSGPGSALAYVVSANVHRRHLTAMQRAFLAVELLPKLEREARSRQATSRGGARPQLSAKIRQAGCGKATAEAGELLGVSARYVQLAKQILREAPELRAALSAGEMTVSEVRSALRRKTERESTITLMEKADQLLSYALTFFKGKRVNGRLPLSDARTITWAGESAGQLIEAALAMQKRELPTITIEECHKQVKLGNAVALKAVEYRLRCENELGLLLCEIESLHAAPASSSPGAIASV
jgi:ParB-like chromosome segregation protein Spo0J